MVTVFIYPSAFHKDGKPVAQYAFPLATVGTALLSFGMFHCAFIIERSSKEYYLYPSKPSKIYWLQPGQQKVGDQHFGAFMAVNEGPDAQPTMNLSYIKSTKHLKYYERRKQLLFATGLTMLGFVTQFVGLRGLHSSVIMGQMAATLFMSVVRTSLRTKRIDLRENQLSEEDQKLTPHNQQELDCFAFHLEGIDKFELLSSTGNELSNSQYSFSSAPALVSQSSDPTPARTNVIHTRARLVELTSGSENSSSPGWDDLPMRKIAQNLARTIEMTMDLLSSWECRSERAFDFKLGYRYKPVTPKSAAYVSGCHTIRLERSEDTLRWRIDDKQLEAILGLWTWSMLRSNEDWPQTGFCRLVGLDQTEAGTEEADLYFHKWIYRQTEARMVSSGVVGDSNRLFGVDSSKGTLAKEILVVKTQNGLGIMAAQDMYIRFLLSVLDDVDELGGNVDFAPGSQNTFLAQSSRLDELVGCFEACSLGLGSREDALLCIVPVLRHCNLLPELAADSPSARKRIEQSLGKRKWMEAFSAVKWLCERSEGVAYQHSVFELGYLCRRAMLDRDSSMRQIGVNEVLAILKGDIRARYYDKLRQSRRAGWMRSGGSDWWRAFSIQLGWCAWHIAKASPDMHHIQAEFESAGVTESSIPSRGTNTDEEQAERAKSAFLLWLLYKEPKAYDEDLSSEVPRLALNWAMLRDHEFMLHCLLLIWIDIGDRQPEFLHGATLLAARCGSRSSIQTMVRRGVSVDLQNPQNGQTALTQTAVENDVGSILILLDSGADVDARSYNGRTPLMASAYMGHSETVRLLLEHGAEVDVQDDDGITALLWATSGNHVTVMGILLEHGAGTKKAGKQGHTPLFVAAEEGHLEAIHLLCHNEADVDAQLTDGSTALMMAIQANHPHAVRALLTLGADWRKKDWNGQTALDLAKERLRRDIIPILEDMCI